MNQTMTDSQTQTTNRYAWVVISLCALFLFYKYILQVSPSVMTHQLMAAFHVQGAGMGNLAATYFYTYLVVQLLVGPLLDKYSLRLLTASAIAISALGALGFAFAQSLAAASLARALMGVGAAFATVSYMKAAAVWFKPQYFAFVGGLLATAAMAGAVFGEAPLAYLIAHAGWRHSLQYCAVGGLVLAAAFLVCVPDKTPAMNPSSASPQFSLIFKDFVELLKSKNNWLLTFYSGLAFSPIAVFGGLWGNSFLETAYQLSTTKAASLTSLVFLGLALGGPLLGALSDLLKQRYSVMLGGLWLSFVGIVAALYLPLSVFWLGVFLFLFGFGTGAFMLGFAMGKELNKLALAASVIALINTGDAIFGAFTDPLTGKLLDLFWDGKVVEGVHQFSVLDYRVALSLLPVYLVGAFFFLLVLKTAANKRI